MNKTSAGVEQQITALRREAERLEEDATYSSKGHFNAEDAWMPLSYWLGVRPLFLQEWQGRLFQ